jgi:DNA polymerase-3 subunit gamma/tau
MSYLVLARKWRPQTFDDLVGQEHVTRTLQNAIKSGRVAHGFLLCGTRGVGKTTTARLLAKALNCEKGPAVNPCNECGNCREITAGNAVDVLEIDGASNRGINEVRQIIENVRYQPAKSRFKIYIIDEVHQVTHDAFNALLKTLEEPPAHVKFIFATTEAHKVPQTILSRCQRYDFKRIPLRQIADSLASICKAEKIEISDSGLLLVAREAEGSMRDSQSLLDQVIAFAGKKIRDEDVVAALGVADRKLLYAVGRALVEREPAEALEQLAQLHVFGYDLRRFAREMLEHFRNLAVARIDGGDALLSDLGDDERQEVRDQAQKISAADIDRAFRILLAAEDEIGRSPYPRLILEMAAVRIATMPEVVPVDEVLRRLDTLAAESPRAGVVSRPTAAGERPPLAESRATAPEPRPAPAKGAGGVVRDSAPPPAAAAGDGSWEGFLAYVGTEKMFLAPHLKECVLSGLGDDKLDLLVPKGFHHDYLARSENLRVVQDLAARFWGRQIQVAMRVSEASLKPAKPVADKAQLRQEALEDPKVRTVLEVLGGELKEVKPRGARGE